MNVKCQNAMNEGLILNAANVLQKLYCKSHQMVHSCFNDEFIMNIDWNSMNNDALSTIL